MSGGKGVCKTTLLKNVAGNSVEATSGLARHRDRYLARGRGQCTETGSLSVQE